MAAFCLFHLLNKNVDKFCIGDYVLINYQLYDSDKVNCTFEGNIIKIKNKGITSSISVKKVCMNVQIVSTFFVFSPLIKKISVRHTK